MYWGFGFFAYVKGIVSPFILLSMDMQLEIASAFERLFCSVGYKKTTVDQVANELKISKKTIYKYFSSKEEVYQYLVDRFAQNDAVEMRNQLQAIEGEREMLEMVNGFCFERLRRAIEAGREEVFSFYYPNDIMMEAFQRAYRELIRSILQQGAEKGIFCFDDLNLCMEYIEAVIARSIELAKSGSYPDIEKQNMEMVLRMIKS